VVGEAHGHAEAGPQDSQTPSSAFSTRLWQQHVLSNAPFYCGLVPLAAEAALVRVGAWGDAALASLLKVASMRPHKSRRNLSAGAVVSGDRHLIVSGGFPFCQRRLSPRGRGRALASASATSKQVPQLDEGACHCTLNP
jgi:hypothetical protein